MWRGHISHYGPAMCYWPIGSLPLVVCNQRRRQRCSVTLLLCSYAVYCKPASRVPWTRNRVASDTLVLETLTPDPNSDKVEHKSQSQDAIWHKMKIEVSLSSIDGPTKSSVDLELAAVAQSIGIEFVVGPSIHSPFSPVCPL